MWIRGGWRETGLDQDYPWQKFRFRLTTLGSTGLRQRQADGLLANGTKLLLEFPVDAFDREDFRVKRPAPFHPILMLFMGGIGQRFQIFQVATRSADVLRRTSPPASDAARTKGVWTGLHYALQQQIMLPTISEIVLILEFGPHAR